MSPNAARHRVHCTNRGVTKNVDGELLHKASPFNVGALPGTPAASWIGANAGRILGAGLCANELGHVSWPVTSGFRSAYRESRNKYVVGTASSTTYLPACSDGGRNKRPGCVSVDGSAPKFAGNEIPNHQRVPLARTIKPFGEVVPAVLRLHQLDTGRR